MSGRPQNGPGGAPGDEPRRPPCGGPRTCGSDFGRNSPIPDFTDYVEQMQVACWVFCAVMILRPLIKQMWVRGASRLWLRSCSARLLAFVRVAKAFVADRGGTQDAVHLHKEEMRLNISRRCCWIASLAFVVMISPLEWEANHGDGRTHLAPRRLHHAFCSTILVTIHVFPSLQTPSLLHVWYSLMSLSNLMTVSPLLQYSEHIRSVSVLVFYDCMCLSLVDLSLPMNLFWSVATYLTAAYTVFAGHSTGKGLGPSASDDVLMISIGGTVGMILFHAVINFVAVSSVEGHTYRRDMRAARSILSGICDAVVDLDGEMKLTQPSQTLATLLMYDLPRASAGERVAHFLATEAEQEQFAQEVKSISADNEFCKAFHVNLRDRCGSVVRLEAFGVCAISGTLKESYLVGFREFADCRPLPSAKLTAHPRLRCQSSEVQHADCSSSSALSSDVTSESQEVAVWIDANSAEFTMLRCTSGFEMFAGSSWEEICAVQSCLLHCTDPDQRKDLAFWIRHVLEKSTGPINDGSALIDVVNGVRFRFSEHHHRFRLSAECRLAVVVEQHAGVDPVHSVKLVIERPTWLQGSIWIGRFSAPARRWASSLTCVSEEGGAAAAAAATLEETRGVSAPPELIGRTALLEAGASHGEARAIDLVQL
ncbi:unnamed protein product [Prorocentrum cordatum]|uniref:PAS domain-containing protein n=1 Tax=Prorocentrum cordatum TaxID=2364126 RepID=A0ABN9X4J6_9DINO|nr:unnamed protein product [Polarella glacialis]